MVVRGRAGRGRTGDNEELNIQPPPPPPWPPGYTTITPGEIRRDLRIEITRRSHLAGAGRDRELIPLAFVRRS